MDGGAQQCKNMQYKNSESKIKRMTANANPKPFNISDGLVVRNVKRNFVGSEEQLSLQTTLKRGRNDDASEDILLLILLLLLLLLLLYHYY